MVDAMAVPRTAHRGWRYVGSAAALFGLGTLVGIAYVEAQTRNAPPAVQRLNAAVKWYYLRYRQWADAHVDVIGLEDQRGIFALNHGYVSGVDGFLFAFMLAHRTGRVPVVVITGEKRSFAVRLQRFVLEKSGLAIVVPPLARNATEKEREAHRHLTTEKMTEQLKRGRDIVIFPAGNAVADGLGQLEGFSRSIVFAARDSGAAIHPVAVGGLPWDWTEEEFLEMGQKASRDPEVATSFLVRIGTAIRPSRGETEAETRDRVVASLREQMAKIPGLLDAAPLDATEGRLRIKGRTRTYVRRGSKRLDAIPVLMSHSFQGSRLEAVPGLDKLLERLNLVLIISDRSGIGESTPRQHATPEHEGEDLMALMEALFPGRLTMGLAFSGGTVPMLMTSRLAGQLVMGLVSPMRVPSFLATLWAMAPADRYRLLMARFYQQAVLQVLEGRKALLDRDPDAFVREWMKRQSKDDQRLFAGNAEARRLLLENRREGYRRGARHVLRDLLMLIRPLPITAWNFAHLPVLLWHGEDDTTVPIEIAEQLEHYFPLGHLERLPGRGQYFIMEEMERILTQMLALFHHERARLRPRVQTLFLWTALVERHALQTAA